MHRRPNLQRFFHRLELLAKYQNDPEVMRKTGRPCVLIVRLKYKGLNQDFAVPLRSNISANTPKNQYFSLPPRSSTKPGNRHGLHYIKMFPVEKQYIRRYRTEGNSYALLIQSIIDRNAKQIVKACQSYLSQYEKGYHPQFSTNIDFLLKKIDNTKEK